VQPTPFSKQAAVAGPVARIVRAASAAAIPAGIRMDAMAVVSLNFQPPGADHITATAKL
jgi:hypothetical protein